MQKPLVILRKSVNKKQHKSKQKIAPAFGEWFKSKFKTAGFGATYIKHDSVFSRDLIFLMHTSWLEGSAFLAGLVVLPLVNFFNSTKATHNQQAPW